MSLGNGMGLKNYTLAHILVYIYKNRLAYEKTRRKGTFSLSICE